MTTTTHPSPLSPATAGVLHFVGIGGIGMSGIAEGLATLGYTVQGSDAHDGYNLDRLRARGVTVFIGHDASHLATPNITAVVVSSAIPPGNPELLEARRLKIPVVRRADMLAEMMRHKINIAVAGTHGKTTTTSLVGAILESAVLDPTIINGGIIQSHGTTTRMGSGDYMVVESDESDGSFLRLPATYAIITNIDPEHMEHYGSFDAVRAAYRAFIERLPFYGAAFACVDHAVVASLISDITDRRIFTYGIDTAAADIRGTHIRLNNDGATFNVTFSGRLTGSSAVTITDLKLPLMGIHNVLNALAALGVAYTLGVGPDRLRTALTSFAGVKRRFTKTGVAHGITVIDDYAHHPVEIQATLRAARQAVADHQGRVIAIMQPHRYTRLNDLFPEFCTAFADADHVIVTDVYAAGEDPIDGITGDALADGITRGGHQGVTTCTGAADPSTMPVRLAAIIAAVAQAGDMILCLGAGSITTWAYALPDALAALPGDAVPASRKSGTIAG